MKQIVKISRKTLNLYLYILTSTLICLICKEGARAQDTQEDLNILKDQEVESTLASSSAKNLNDTIICIRTYDKWVGFQSPNKLFYAKLDFEKPCIELYKETTLSEAELTILNRFLEVRKLFKNPKENEKISNQQIEIITGISKANIKEAPNLNVKEALSKSTHISIWQDQEFSELILGTSQEAKKNWPEHIENFLKLLFEPSSRATKINCEGVGFIVPLDKPKEIGQQISWASTLRSTGYQFEPVSSDIFKTLPNNLKTMLNHNGFIVPLSTSDLKLMSKLKWEEYPEDAAQRTGLIEIDTTNKEENTGEINNTTQLQNSIIWWGLIDYKGKNYGINAWQNCQD